jgi:hypothetical protein
VKRVEKRGRGERSLQVDRHEVEVRERSYPSSALRRHSATWKAG